MFKGALYKYSYMYSDEYLSESCTKEFNKVIYPDQNHDSFCQEKFMGKEFYFIQSLKYYGFKYESGSYIFQNHNTNKSNFLLICSIVCDGDNYFLLCSPQEFIFKEKYHAYESLSPVSNSFKLVDINDNWVEPLYKYMYNGKTVLCPPYKLF